MRLVLVIVSLAPAVLPIACVFPVGNFEQGRDLALADAQWIQLGTTTSQELPIQFGPPALTTRGGVTHTQYGSVETEGRASSMIWTHHVSYGVTAEASTERLTVFFDEKTDLVTDWLFEGDVNGFWQVLGPEDTPLAAPPTRAGEQPEGP